MRCVKKSFYDFVDTNSGMPLPGTKTFCIYFENSEVMST